MHCITSSGGHNLVTPCVVLSLMNRKEGGISISLHGWYPNANTEWRGAIFTIYLWINRWLESFGDWSSRNRVAFPVNPFSLYSVSKEILKTPEGDKLQRLSNTKMQQQRPTVKIYETLGWVLVCLYKMYHLKNYCALSSDLNYKIRHMKETLSALFFLPHNGSLYGCVAMNENKARGPWSTFFFISNLVIGMFASRLSTILW